MGSGGAPKLSLPDSAPLLVVVCRSTLAATLGIVVGVRTVAGADTAAGAVGRVMEAIELVVTGVAGAEAELTVMTGVELAICTTAGEWVVGTRVTVVVVAEDEADWAGVVLLLMMVCCRTVAVGGWVVTGFRVWSIVVPADEPTCCRVCTLPTVNPLLIIEADTDG